MSKLVAANRYQETPTYDLVSILWFQVKVLYQCSKGTHKLKQYNRENSVCFKPHLQYYAADKIRSHSKHHKDEPNLQKCLAHNWEFSSSHKAWQSVIVWQYISNTYLVFCLKYGYSKCTVRQRLFAHSISLVWFQARNCELELMLAWATVSITFIALGGSLWMEQGKVLLAIEQM